MRYIASFISTATIAFGLANTVKAQNGVEQEYSCSYEASGIITTGNGPYGTLPIGDPLSIAIGFGTIGIDGVIPTLNGSLRQSEGTLTDGIATVSHTSGGILTADITEIRVDNSTNVDGVAFLLANGYTGTLGGIDTGNTGENPVNSVSGILFPDPTATILSDTNYPIDGSILNQASYRSSIGRLDLPFLDRDGNIQDRPWVEVTVITGGCMIVEPPVEPIMCNGLLATIVGTDQNDTIMGTEGDDVIVALKGNDTVFGLGGDDTICGNQGNDTINGGKGDDHLRGGNGNDTISGNRGNDTLRGRKGNDSLHGGRGDDSIRGDEGNDTCSGGNGLDSDQECEVTDTTEATIG